jgi:hypothetical protein
MTAQEILHHARRAGATLFVIGGKLKAAPAGALPPDLKAAIRERAAEIKTFLGNEHARAEALAVLTRLKTYALPAGRMPAAHEVAQRLTSALGRFESNGELADDSDDPTAILDVLRAIERELITLGGAPDRQLVQAVATVEAAFPSAILVEVRKLQ